MARIRNYTHALCLVALVAMGTTFLSCHAAGRDIGTTSGFSKLCVASEGCAPPVQANGNLACKAYCVGQSYDKDKSHCTADGGGICCCEK